MSDGGVNSTPQRTRSSTQHFSGAHFMAQEYTVLRTFHLRLAKLCPRHLHDMFTTLLTPPRQPALPQEAQPLPSAQGPRRSKGAGVARERRERRRMREEGVGEKREEENMNRTYVDNAVSDSLTTWWRRAWWIRIDDGSSMLSARGRRRVWRAARRAAEKARDGDG